MKAQAEFEVPVEVVHQPQAIVPAPKAAITATFMGGQVVAALDGVDVDKLERLMNLELVWQANEAKKAYVAAMKAAKAEIPEIQRNRTVTYATDKGTTSYRHATLDNICDKVVPVLSKHGLTHSWKTQQADGKIRVTCQIRHEMGHKEEEATLEALPDTTGSKNAVQAIGSTTYYLERYTFLAAFGIAVHDQDTDGTAVSEASKLTVRAIMEAPDLSDLDRIFKDSYKECVANKDAKAMLAIINAKDARKKQIMQGEPA